MASTAAPSRIQVLNLLNQNILTLLIEDSGSELSVALLYKIHVPPPIWWLFNFFAFPSPLISLNSCWSRVNLSDTFSLHSDKV